MQKELTDNLPEIPTSTLQLALEAGLNANLPAITAGLALLYLIFAISHILVLPATIAVKMSSTASISAIVLMLATTLLRTKKLPIKYANLAGFGITLIIWFNSTLHLYLTADPIQTTNLFFLFIGASCFFVATRWLVAIFLLSYFSWLLIAWRGPQSPEWLHFGFALITTTVLCLLIFFTRVHTLRRLERLRLQDEQRRNELQNALIAQQRSEQRTRSIIDNMMVGVVTMDVQGQINDFNAAAQHIFGYDAQQLNGKSFKTLLPAQQQLNDDQFVEWLRGRAVGRITEWQGQRIDNRIFPFELSLNEYNNADGHHFVGHVRDISERHEIDRLKNEFISSVSHELRTPLTSIHGALGLLAAGALGDIPTDAQEAVEIAARNCVRLLALINDILDFERLESGKLELNRQSCTVAQIMQRACEAVQGFAEQHQVAVISESIDQELHADPDRLVQVVVNLLSNAIKFSPKEAAVKLTAQSIDNYLEFQVIDRGRGVPLALQAAIFNRFQQVEASDSRRQGGTGLGLAICKGMVEAHGGTIGVISALDQGSTFWFRIPINQSANS